MSNEAIEALEAKLAYKRDPLLKNAENKVAHHNGVYVEARAEVAELKRQIAELETAIAQLKGEPTWSDVHVPGMLTAHYEDGKITRWVFMPAEGDAGYFGPTTEVIDGDESLDVRLGGTQDHPDDGPFWQAVTEALSGTGTPTTFTVEWVC